MKLIQKGFSTVETLLVLLIVVIIGATGAYVYTANKNANNTLNSANAATQSSPDQSPLHAVANAGAYKGWKSYTTKKYGVTFKYPANWTLDDQSTTTSDMVNLSASSDFVAALNVMDQGAGGKDGLPPVLSSQKVSVVDRVGFIDLFSSSGSPAQTVDEFMLSQSSKNPFETMQFTKFYIDLEGHESTPETLAAAKTDLDLSNLALIAASITLK